MRHCIRCGISNKKVKFDPSEPYCPNCAGKVNRTNELVSEEILPMLLKALSPPGELLSANELLAREYLKKLKAEK